MKDLLWVKYVHKNSLISVSTFSSNYKGLVQAYNMSVGHKGYWLNKSRYNNYSSIGQDDWCQAPSK